MISVRTLLASLLLVAGSLYSQNLQPLQYGSGPQPHQTIQQQLDNVVQRRHHQRFLTSHRFEQYANAYDNIVQHLLRSVTLARTGAEVHSIGQCELQRIERQWHDAQLCDTHLQAAEQRELAGIADALELELAARRQPQLARYYIAEPATLARCRQILWYCLRTTFQDDLQHIVDGMQELHADAAQRDCDAEEFRASLDGFLGKSNPLMRLNIRNNRVDRECIERNIEDRIRTLVHCCSLLG